MIKINKRFYLKQKNRLLEKKQRDFELTQIENEREIVKLRNEKLKMLIWYQNQETLDQVTILLP